MKLPGYCRSWQDRFKDSDLDRRRDYWCWGEAGDLLLVRPGPALDLAREFVDNLPPAGPRPRLRSLTTLDMGRVTVSHTALRRQGNHTAEQVSQLHLGAGGPVSVLPLEPEHHIVAAGRNDIRRYGKIVAPGLYTRVPCVRSRIFIGIGGLLFYGKGR